MKKFSSGLMQESLHNNSASSRIAEIREGQFMALIEKTPYFSLEIMCLLTDRLRRQVET